MTIIIRIASVAALVALTACSTGVSSTQIPTPSEAAELSPSAAPTTAASAAPESVEPSAAPSDAALVVRLEGAGEAGRVHLVTVLEDGRVITSDQAGVNPPTERRLTAEGVQLVRDAMDATGLTDVSADYSPVANPGKELTYGGAGPLLEVGSADGETVTITWYLFADTAEDFAAPQPEAEALEALAARLTTLEEWLPADAWADDGSTP